MWSKMGTTDSRSDGGPGDRQERRDERPGSQAAAESRQGQERVLAGQSGGSPVDAERPTRSEGQVPHAARTIVDGHSGDQVVQEMKSVETQTYADEKTRAYADLPEQLTTEGTTGARYGELDVPVSRQGAFGTLGPQYHLPIQESSPQAMPLGNPPALTVVYERQQTHRKETSLERQGGEPGADDRQVPGGRQGGEPGADDRQVPGGTQGGEPGADDRQVPAERQGGEPGADDRQVPGGRQGGEPGADDRQVPGGRQGGEPGADDRQVPGGRQGGEPGADDRQVPAGRQGGEPGPDDRQVPAGRQGGEPGADDRQVPAGRQGGEPGADDRQVPAGRQGGEPGADDRQVPAGRQGGEPGADDRQVQAGRQGGEPGADDRQVPAGRQGGEPGADDRQVQAGRQGGEPGADDRQVPAGRQGGEPGADDRQVQAERQGGEPGADDRQVQAGTQGGEPGADDRQVQAERQGGEPGADDRQVPAGRQGGEPGADDRQVTAGTNRGVDAETRPPERAESVHTSVGTQTEINAERCRASVNLLLDHSGNDAQTIEHKEHIIHEMSQGSRQVFQNKTAHGLAVHVLKQQTWKTDKLWSSCTADSNVSEAGVHNVLKELDHHNQKIGHIVEYFSLEHSKRLDIIRLIQKIHDKCDFCETIYSSVT